MICLVNSNTWKMWYLAFKLALRIPKREGEYIWLSWHTFKGAFWLCISGQAGPWLWIPGGRGKHRNRLLGKMCYLCLPIPEGWQFTWGRGHATLREMRQLDASVSHLVQETLPKNSDQVFLPCLLGIFAARLPISREPWRTPLPFHSIPLHSSQASCKHLAKLHISAVLPSSHTIFEPTPVFLLYPHCQPLSSPPGPLLSTPSPGSLLGQPHFPQKPALGPFWKSAMLFPSLRPFQNSLLNTNSQ